MPLFISSPCIYNSHQNLRTLVILYTLRKWTLRIIATCPKDKHSQDSKSIWFQGFLSYVTQSHVWPKKIKMLLLCYLFTKIPSVLLLAFSEVSPGHQNLELKGILTLPNPYIIYPSQSQCSEYEWIFSFFNGTTYYLYMWLLLFLDTILLKKN